MSYRRVSMPKCSPVRISTEGLSPLEKWHSWFVQSRVWELQEDYIFNLYDVSILIPTGFRTDFASVPRAFWPILSPTGVLMIPGLLHDFYYRHHFFIQKSGYLTNTKFIPCFSLMGRGWADDLLAQISSEINHSNVPGDLAYVSLAVFGGFAWNSNRKKDSNRGLYGVDLVGPYGG